MRVVIMWAIIGLMTLPAWSQAPGVLWTQTLGGAGLQEGKAVEQTSDGGYIVAGGTLPSGPGSDFYAAKLDALGNPEWSIACDCGDYEYAEDIVQTGDGGFLLVGTAITMNGTEGQLIKIAPDGSSFTCLPRLAESLKSVKLSGGGCVVVGVSLSTLGDQDLFIAGTDAGGGVLWQHSFGGGWTEIGNDVAVTSDGGFIIAGARDQDGSGDFDIWLVRTDVNGDTLWTRTYGGTGYDVGSAVQATSDGGYIVSATAYSLSGGYFVFKTDASGNMIWSYTQADPTFSAPADVIQASDGRFLTCGSYQSVGPDGLQFYLEKLDTEGGPLWMGIYGFGAHDQAWDLEQTSDGGYILAGTSYSPISETSDIFVVKTAYDETLPVELATFDAVAQAGGIRVSFRTASENGNDYFEILRDGSANGTFTQIASLPSQGNSSSGHEYSYLDTDVTQGQTYWYYLVDVSLTGDRTEHRDRMRSATATGAALPVEYSLSAYPSPFNAFTVIGFSIPEATQVRLAIYDVSGQLVRRLLEAPMPAGEHSVTFDASGLPSGVYLARLERPSGSLTRKLVLLK